MSQAAFSMHVPPKREARSSSANRGYRVCDVSETDGSGAGQVRARNVRAGVVCGDW